MTPQFSDALNNIRLQFAAQLPTRMEVIRLHFLQLSPANWQTNKVAELHRLAHSLTGSAGTFGMLQLSVAARTLEIQLATLKTDAPKNDEWQQLITNMQQLEQHALIGLQSCAPSLQAPPISRTYHSPLIHIVDDDNIQAEYLGQMLRDNGYRIAPFTSPSEFRANHNKGNRPDAVLMDMIFAEGDSAGAKLIEELGLGKDSGIPVIVISIRDDLDGRLAALRAGACRYLTKPINDEHLIDLLDALTDHQPPSPYRVLMVDDDELLLEAQASMLRSSGMAVTTLSQPLQILEVLTTIDPDIVVLDMYMPEATGPELAAVLRERDAQRHLPILFLSAETDINRQLRALNLGGDDFLIKPVQAAHLIAAVSARARRARQNVAVQLRLQETLYKREREHLALDHHALVSVTDETGKITYINNKFCLISGYPRDELLGQDHRILKSDQHPAKYFQNMWQSITSGHIWQGEICNRRKDGSLYWVSSTITPFLNEAGKPYQYVSIRTVITERKLMEEQLSKQKKLFSMLHRATTSFVEKADFRAAMEDMLNTLIKLTGSKYGFCGEVLYDSDDTPYLKTHAITDVSWNLETKNMYQCHEKQGLEFRNLKTLFGQVMTTRQPVVSNNVVSDPRAGGLPPGHPTMHSFLGTPIFHGDRLTGMYAISNRPEGYDSALQEFLLPLDSTYGALIHSKHMMEAEEHNRMALIEAKETADRANMAKSDFLSSMSHELRTPMNAILGFGQLMEYDDELSADNQDNVHEILRAGQHLLELINDVLDLAKVESGHINLSLETVQLCPVVDECLTLVASLAEKRNIQVSHIGLADIFVYADRTRLKQILLNLLSNAIKYNHRSGHVTLEVQVTETTRVQIRVTDTGLGIPAERLAELFQPFNRLDAEYSDIEGTGIGLTITRRIVELMNGTVDVHSELGVGSTFWIELPTATPNGDPTPATTHATGTTRIDSKAQKVLYIDDNPSNLRLLTQIMARRQHIQLHTAHTPELGIELALTRKPDLILLDVNMPNMDGYQVLKVFKDNAKLNAIPIIAFTANAMDKDIKRGKEAGFSDYLTKPIEVGKLFNMLDRHLPDLTETNHE